MTSINSSTNNEKSRRRPKEDNKKHRATSKGWLGSVNDSRLLRNSGFYRMCEGGQRLNGHPVAIGSLNMREYIIGNGGYPLLPWLITPLSGDVVQEEDDTYDDVFVENGTNMATNELVDPVERLVREALMTFVNGDMNDVSM
ncbi:hypothetical protein SUGI_0331210 [Cryptomeria japonica]|nr:hypothetical protein SUGI_0331210 [Cryptomeria japonica]